MTLLVVGALTVAGSQLGLSIASAGEDPVCADGQHAEAGLCVPDTIDTSSVITGPTGATAEASDPESGPTGPTAPSTGPSSTGGGKDSGQPNDGPSGPASGAFQNQDTPDDSGRHIDICHATGSGKYQAISPSISATGDIQGGHQNHDEDIIPPNDTDGDTTGITAKNWDAQGQATWENDCVVPDGGGDEGDVTISKVANVDGAVGPGDSFTYTITVTNTFESSKSVTVTDGVPSAFEVTGATSSDLTCETTGNSVSCSGDVAGGGSATVTVSVTVADSDEFCGQSVENTANVSVGEAVGNGDSASASVDIDCGSEGGRHVRICHATGNGGYQDITPSISATGDIQGGHQNHDDDIIPPFDTDGDTTGITSKNWDAAGQATWENDCVPPEGEVTISKVANVEGPVAPGDSFTYTITVTNTFVASRTVTVTDDVPSAFEVTDVTSADLDCDATGNSISCSGDVGGNGSATITVSVTVSDSEEFCDGSFENTATFTLGEAQGDAVAADGGSSSASVDVDCPEQPNVSITKSADATDVAEGDIFHYTITVANADGAGTASDVSVVDNLPTGITLDSLDDGGADCSATSGNDVSCTIASLGGGDSVSIVLTVHADGEACGEIVNTATFAPTLEQPQLRLGHSIRYFVGSMIGEGELTSNQAVVNVECPTNPGIEVTKTGPDSAETGDGFVFTITVKNTGDVPVDNVSVTDDVPPAFDVQEGSLPDDEGHSCQAEGNSVSCQDSGTLDPGDSVSFTIPVVVTYEGECAHITNTASATASVAQGEVGGQVRASQVDEGLEGSDSWTVDVNCGGGGGTNNPVLSVVKTPDAAQVDSGGQIGFTITLKNLGPGDAHGVTLNDSMPTVSGLQWQVGALPAGCSFNSNALSCSFATLAEGASVSIHATATAPAGLCGTITNVASADGEDTGPASGSASITLDCTSGIVVDKTGPAKALVGQTITYTITVSLIEGSAPVDGITVTDPICDSAPEGPQGDGGTAGLLEPGETWTYTCTHLVTEDDPDPLVNTVLVSGNGADGTDSQETDIIHPAIHLDKSADVDSATPGETIHYRYDVTNTGDVELTNVSVDDDVIGKICAFDHLAVGETRTCRARYVVPTNAPTAITNVAVATASYAAPASPSVAGRARGFAMSAAAGGAAQNVVSDSDKVTIPVVAGVTVTKTPPGGLAFTGSEAVMPLVALALLLLTAGTWLMWVARRRGRGGASAE